MARLDAEPPVSIENLDATESLSLTESAFGGREKTEWNEPLPIECATECVVVGVEPSTDLAEESVVAALETPEDAELYDAFRTFSSGIALCLI